MACTRGRSVDPRHGDPLRRARQRLHRLLEDPDRLFDVVVHDSQVKEVAVRLLQKVRLLNQALEAAVVLQLKRRPG